MDWYVVDKEYINYLKQFDSKVGYVEYGSKLKLHLGIVMKVQSLDIYLLQKEKKIIDSMQEMLYNKAKKLYAKCINSPNSTLTNRCCNFLLLEEKAKLYKK